MKGQKATWHVTSDTAQMMSSGVPPSLASCSPGGLPSRAGSPHGAATWPQAASPTPHQLSSPSVERAPPSLGSFHEPSWEGCCQHLPNLNGLVPKKLRCCS